MKLTKRWKYHSMKLFLIFLFIFILIGCTKKDIKSDQSLLDNTKVKTQQTKEPIKSNFLIYNNPSDGIKIKYPADWIEEDMLGGISYFFHPQNKDATTSYPTEGLMITPGVFDNPITLDEYAEKTIELYKSDFPDMVIIDSSKTTLTGNPAKKLIVDYKDGNFNVKTMFIWTIKNNKMYMIAYSAEQDKYVTLLETAQEMINSFEIS